MSQTATRATGRGAWPVERFETPQQCAGYWVCDPQGRKIGRLKRLFLNGSGGAEYAEVKVGLFGIRTVSLYSSTRNRRWASRETVLIPVQTVSLDAQRRFLVLE